MDDDPVGAPAADDELARRRDADQRARRRDADQRARRRDADQRARRRDAAWVAAALDGDTRAFGRLYDAWYDRVFHVARGIVRDPEVAADVAQDAFLAAWRTLAGLDDHLAFGGWLLRIARNAALTRAGKEQRSRPTDDRGLAVIEHHARAGGVAPAGAPAGFGVEDRLGALADPSRMAEDGELVALVHEAAAALGPRDAEVLDLQLRYGLSPAEIGEVMGLNRNAANQLVHRVKGRFAKAVEARVLWRGREPACSVLAGLLRSAGVDRFGEDAVKIADRHAAGCDDCGERRRLRLQPAALFASVPIAAAPVVLKQQSAHALAAAGVPMDGSAFGPGAASGGGTGPDAGDATPDEHRLDVEGASADGRRRARTGRAAAMAVVAVLVLLVVVALIAVALDEGGLAPDEVATGGGSIAPSASAAPPAAAAVPARPSSTGPTDPTGATDPTVTPAGPGSPPSAAPDVAAPGSPDGQAPPAGPSSDPVAPPAPPLDTVAPVAPPTVRLAIDPTAVTTGYPMSTAPRLTWSVTGASSVVVERVTGAGALVLATDPSGTTRVCPGVVTTFGTCEAEVGPATFRVVAVGPDGTVVERSVQLQVFPRPR